MENHVNTEFKLVQQNSAGWKT